MLVLTRRPNEKIVFPSINASVQVLAAKSGKVRLGIQAPPGVAILREELLERDGPRQPIAMPFPSAVARSTLRELNHVVRNRLNAATLGLALIRRQLHGGVSRVGLEGTLDKIEREFESLDQQMEKMKEQVAPQRPIKPRKALLVEDDPNECELMAGFLRLAGLEVDTAADGVEALEYLDERGRPDVLLLDMVLPRCDGPTFLRAIRHDPACAGLKIFAVSGHSPVRFGLDSGTTGCDRWFRKPVNPEALLRDLNQDLDNAS